MSRGIWQIGQADTTVEEATTVVQGLNSRGIFPEEKRAVVIKEEEEAAERQRKIVTGIVWGGIGLGMVVVMIYALR